MSDDPFVTKLGLTPPQAAILNRLADATADARELTETRDGVERVYLRFKRNDGGRAAAGYKGATGDCGVRALAIAVFGADDLSRHAWNHPPYARAVAIVERFAATERRKKSRAGQRSDYRQKSSVRTGIYQRTMRRIMVELGWQWRPTMAIGGGCTTHLRSDELPDGRLIVCVSKHYCAVIDGVVHDTYCDDRAGTRCVYGYWFKPDDTP